MEAGRRWTISSRSRGWTLWPALIERTRLNTRLQQFRVNPPSLQIGQHGGGKPAGLRKLEGFPRLRGWLFLGRRGTIAAQDLYRPHKVHLPLPRRNRAPRHDSIPPRSSPRHPGQLVPGQRQGGAGWHGKAGTGHSGGPGPFSASLLSTSMRKLSRVPRRQANRAWPAGSFPTKTQF